MAGTSKPGGLSERLRKRREENEKRIEAERQRYEELITNSFAKLGASASSAAASAQSSIESDLEAVVDRQRSVLQWSWGLPLAAGIGLFLLILLGNWALTQWLSISIRSRIETREELAAEIGQQRRLLRELEARTWGVELREMSNGRFVVLEQGSEPETGWVVDERPAIRLSSD